MMPVRSSRRYGRVVACESTSLLAMSAHPVVDVTIIGAGPAGLAAAYYAGHREASCRIIESLEQLGGLVAAV
jgi:ribulose 1,5-bisphosphate synthetase/thiazole synthase